MGQVQHMLWQVCTLDDGSDLDCPFLFDELPYRVEELRRKLKLSLAFLS